MPVHQTARNNTAELAEISIEVYELEVMNGTVENFIPGTDDKESITALLRGLLKHALTEPGKLYISRNIERPTGRMFPGSQV